MYSRNIIICIFKVGCALLYIAQNAFYLNVYRLLLGFSGGGSFVIIPIYVSEIADTK